MRKVIENNTVKIFAVNEDGGEYLSVYQDAWPNGEPFASSQEADAWADSVIDAITNPNSEFVPGVSPSQPLLPRPIEEDPANLVAEELDPAAITE